ncbi:MAG: RNA polymerase sigma-I factor [Bacillota bacterium]
MDVRKIFNFNKSKSTEKNSNEAFISTLKQIKEGNQLLRDEFISNYKPFIAKVTSNALGMYIDSKNSDEFSIALSAFNEAIDKYDLSRNYNFFLFSEQVIKRRLIDYHRRNKNSKELPFSYFGDSTDFNEKYLLFDSYFSFEDVETKDEIISFNKKLLEFGITLTDLVLNVPKHKDSRKLCIGIARTLADDDRLFNELIKNKSIPRSELVKKAKVHSRTIGNNRKYIIALCLILRSNLNLSKRYLDYAMEGGK